MLGAFRIRCISSSSSVGVQLFARSCPSVAPGDLRRKCSTTVGSIRLLRSFDDSRLLCLSHHHHHINSRSIHSTRPLFLSSTYYRKDHYEVLGIARNASTRDVKRAYIELAKKYHPDANPGNSEAATKFNEIAQAYTVLSSRQQRAAYDSGNSGDPHQQQNRSDRGGFDSVRRSSSTYETYHSSVDPEDLFRKIFGADFNARDYMKGAKRVWVDFAQTDGTDKTQQTIVRLSFREAAKGCEKMIKAKTVTTCDKCMGLGAEPGRPVQLCPFCDGLGFEIFKGHDHENLRSSCRFCHGKGHNVVHKCSNCLGYGRILVDRTMVLPIPAGIVDGETIKVNVEHHEDDKVLGGVDQAQVIFITFRVEPSDYFRVDEENGVDLHSDATVSLAQAIFGGHVKIDGLYSDEKIRVEPGSDSHVVIKLDAKGLKKNSGYGYGDHYVHLKIAIPKKLTDEQRKLLKSYAEIETDTTGEIDGIQKRQDTDSSSKSSSSSSDPKSESSSSSSTSTSSTTASKKRANDLRQGYAAMDDEIDDSDRLEAQKQGTGPSPWIVMLRETVTRPVARQLRIFKAVATALFTSDGSSSNKEKR